MEREKRREGGGTFDRVALTEQLDTVRYINMRSESIAVEDGEGRRREGKRKKVCVCVRV